MPDQSQQYQKTTPPRQQTEENVNNPGDASPESLASNVNRASEGQQAQASQTISGDPHVGTGNLTGDLEPTPRGGTEESESGDNYEDEDAWPYRALQQEAKSRHLPGDGKREELVARLREADQASSNSNLTAGVSDPGPAPADDSPRTEVDSQVVDNGGIQRTEFAQRHAEILQGLSQQRREQQLAAVRDRSNRSEAPAESSDET